LGSWLDSATPHEVTLIEKTLDRIPYRQRQKIERLIYDTAGDSDPLRERLNKQGIEFICPHRSNRKKKPTQDGRKLRRYKRRWTVERTFAWVGSYRRLLVRHDRLLVIYQAFFHIACLLTVLRRL
jgi:transposase